MALDQTILSFIASSGRSWWVLHYTDDSYRYEWQEHPGGNRILLPSAALSPLSEWENTPKKDIKRAMLFAPNGQVGGFTDPDLIFQFKKGHISINAPDIWCDAHILGAVTDSDGNCEYIAYEPLHDRLVRGTDNVNDVKYQSIGRLDPSIISSCK